MINILVVEDNQSIHQLMKAYLEKNGYQVFSAFDGIEAMNFLMHHPIDLMLVDIMMPKMDGLELTEHLRSVGYSFPILMVTAKGQIEDKKKGFTLGVDDYMVKPIDFEELILRIEALLRRAKISSEKKLQVGSVVLTYDDLTITIGEESQLLPKKEFYLLFKLMSYPDKIFTRRDLMDDIWGLDTETDERTVDVHIKRLRQRFAKIEDFKIKTIRGLGYKVERCR